jgi:hypothetical protein
MKAPVRSKSIGTKVTTEEYAVLEACAAEQKLSLSEWARDLLLAAAAEHGTEKPAVLAEVLALRTILLNLFYRLGAGRPAEPDEMQRIIERADAVKIEKALACLQSTRPRTSESPAEVLR